MSATVRAAGLTVVGVVVAGVVLGAGQVAVGSVRAHTAADVAALSAARVLANQQVGVETGRGLSPCGVAERSVRQQKAELLTCSTHYGSASNASGSGVRVRVVLHVPVLGMGSVTVRARAHAGSVPFRWDKSEDPVHSGMP